MNKTIQSNSFRPYSKSLLETWVDHFDLDRNKQLDPNFLVKNLRRCLMDFREFAASFTAEARVLAEQDTVFTSLRTAKEQQNFKLWLEEKISKALDVYWAPLSQAATQYTSPAYQNQVKDLVKLEAQIESLTEKLNTVASASPEARITIDDILLFFDELTLIRISPYTKMALIGIPYRVADAESADEDILAGIAHELGHFLYWRLDDFDCLDIKHEKIIKTVQSSLETKLKTSQHRSIRYVNAWFEELFADFIGASIARENHLKVSKSMVIRNNKRGDRSGRNDHQHVADILRPLVSMYVLNGGQEETLSHWQQFLTDDFPLDPAKIEIELIGEHGGERAITRKATELSPILMNAIDVLSSEMQNTVRAGLFQPHFSNVATVELLSKKAARLATKLKRRTRHEGEVLQEKELTALDIFLEPQILEAGEQSHPHTWTTPSHSVSFTIYHTHQ